MKGKTVLLIILISVIALMVPFWFGHGFLHF